MKEWIKKLLDKYRVDNEEETFDKEVVAYHEAGHTVIAYLLGKDLVNVSLVKTVSGNGDATYKGCLSNQFVSKKSVEEFVKIAYGGRASEEIKYGSEKVTTGASSDITQATKVLSQSVVKYGFYKEKTGLVDYSVLKECGISTGESEALKIVQEESKILYNQVKEVLSENYHLVTALVDTLLEKETMTGEEVAELLEKLTAQPKVTYIGNFTKEETKNLFYSIFSVG